MWPPVAASRSRDSGRSPATSSWTTPKTRASEKITEYCDERGLTPEARLELFLPVCQAIQHAHQKGIIHRDLKPRNILVAEVDGRPTPKVIDFGIAKATDRRLTEESIGETGAVLGTPSYMSPEQADPASSDIDTRTDVYALGVTLYELLTGSHPFDTGQCRGVTALEMLRILREQGPARPSSRLGQTAELESIAGRRGIEPGRLLKWLRRDFDWIVMKAMETDRDRRYQTAIALEADIRRYLADEPLEARPPSRGYRLQKFVRRNRGAVIAASMILLAMVGGVLGTSIGLIEARTQGRYATAALARALAEAEGNERARKAEADQRALAEQANRRALDALMSFTDDLMGKLLGGRQKLNDTELSVLRNAQK